MSADRLNWLNIILMIGAACAAVVAPFHVFLFAYAILGPLHYLTEISWLERRDFFASRARPRSLFLALVATTSIVMLYGFAAEMSGRAPDPVWEIGLFLLVFIAAAAALTIHRMPNVIAALVVAAAGISLIAHRPEYGIIAYLLITIIHVFVFTGVFMLAGALREKRMSGYVAIGVFVLAAVVTTTIRVPFAVPAGSVRILYAAFEQLNLVILRLARAPIRNVYAADAVGVMRFIAFAYLYHYLNWFSKTSIIGWHHVTRARAVTIILLWLAGVTVYLVSYKAGFALFYVLSAAHVMLEFPLNHRTFATLAAACRPN